MDPGTLGIVLNGIVTIATTIQQKINKLDHISSQEMESAGQYRKALVAFSSDVEEVTTKVNTIIHHGNKSSISGLLNTRDGKTSFDRLSTALGSAEDLLKTQERAADALIVETQARSRKRSLDFTSLLSDPDTDHQHFNTILGSAITRVNDSHTQVMRLFEQFYALYGIHNQAGLGGSQRPPPSPTRRCSLINSLQLSFYDRPFDIVINQSCALEIAECVGPITSDKSRLDSYTLAMKDMAERWVDRDISETNVANIGRTQTNVLQNLQTVLNAELTTFGEADKDISHTENARCTQLIRINVGTQKAITRDKNKRFSIAFCGMVKAGKSLFLNALMGHMILPSDELPATAWPCRVRHVKGQLTARLEIDADYFQKAIDKLRTRKFGAMMAQYKDISALQGELLGKADIQKGGDCDVATAEEYAKKREIYNNWIDLPQTTKSNLNKFETGGYRIPDIASGDEHVRDLLAQVNDVVRLCRRMNVELPSSQDTTWPLLTIEFEALRDETFEGEFEFIDLPGIGESHSDYFHFESLTRYVASEVNAIVPIISLKEVAKNEWKHQLVRLMKDAIGHPPELALCTHLDYVARDRVESQIANVAKAFWPKGGRNSRHRILPCSSRMGLSASALLRMSIETKPNFQDIWVENAIEYECAAKILGAHRSESTLQQLSFEDWKMAVVDQLDRSGLKKAIKRLVTDMVVSSQWRFLRDEGGELSRQLHKAIDNQHWVLLKMIRSTADREQAYHDFKIAKKDFEAVLDDWALISTNIQESSSKKFSERYWSLEKEGFCVALQAVENIEKRIKNMTGRKQAGINENGELVFYNLSAAEDFHQQVQTELSKLLQSLARPFITFVRTLADQSREEHIMSLKSKIQASIKLDSQPAVKEEIIEELTDCGATVQALAFSSIRRKAMDIIVTRHNAVSAYRALQVKIAKTFLRPRSIDVFAKTTGDDDSEEYERSINDLGFMLRAPIAAVAIVPWVFGSAIWPFMINSKKYVLKKEAFVEELKKHIIRPFLDTLKKEGQSTLQKMMAKSSDTARASVNDALAGREQRYHDESVRMQNSAPLSEAAVASVLGTFFNLIAADAALQKLQKHLRDLPLNPS